MEGSDRGLTALIAHLHKAQHHEKLGKMSNEALKAIIQDL
jgi:hypothetical protein